MWGRAGLFSFILFPVSLFAAPSCWELFKHIEPATVLGKTIPRMSACFSRGECIILFGKPRLSEVAQTPELIEQLFADNGFPLPHENSNNPSVNCLGHVCLESGLPLPPHSWINDNRSFHALVLEEFAELPVVFTKSNIANFELSAEVIEGDLVLLADPFGVAHAGIVRKHNVENWVDSKLGEGMVVRSRLSALFVGYHSYEVRILRKREKFPEGSFN